MMVPLGVLALRIGSLLILKLSLRGRGPEEGLMLSVQCRIVSGGLEEGDTHTDISRSFHNLFSNECRAAVV